MTVKKFNEFIEEGFLSKTINRSKSGEKRNEDKISIESAADCFGMDLNRHKVYPIDEYNGYFIVIYNDYKYDKTVCVETYHYPNEWPICTFECSDEIKNIAKHIPQIKLKPETEFFGIYDMSKEDQKIFDSDEFISAINNTIIKIYK